MTYVQDPRFGEIVDFDRLRGEIRAIYDHIHPEFNLLGVVHTLSRLSGDIPSESIALGASTLAYSLLVAADEPELAAEHKDKLFTLGWTEEHCGSDLLSVRTEATPVGDPERKMYHLRGRKWLINNSYHGDFHVVVAKIDPTKNGPRSLSLFLVPRSSTSDWERLPTHVLSRMVLTKFEIDGPGRLLGKPGQGLQIVQRMANISRSQCTYTGVAMVREAIPATIEHLASKRIFGQHPIEFNNVLRQLYQIVLRASFYEWQLYRNVALGARSRFLQFYGTQLKSWLLLRINELLGHNLLVAGSKGFLAESVIGRDAIDSFVLPVFDGHYTINTLMTDKHAARYLEAEEPAQLEERLATLRRDAYVERVHNEIHADMRSLRRPPFFDWADYLERLDLPIELPASSFVAAARALLAELAATERRRDAEHKYKVGDLIHWMESVLAAAELWKVTEEPAYLDTVVLQWNGAVETFNRIVSEGALSTAFQSPLRQRPLAPPDDPRAWLLDLLDVRGRIPRPDLRVRHAPHPGEQPCSVSPRSSSTTPTMTTPSRPTSASASRASSASSTASSVAASWSTCRTSATSAATPSRCASTWPCRATTSTSSTTRAAPTATSPSPPP